MTVTISAYYIPAALTAAVWAWAVLWPMPPRQGDWDFTSPLVALARLAGATIATLAAWLVYFAWLSW